MTIIYYLYCINEIEILIYIINNNKNKKDKYDFPLIKKKKKIVNYHK